MITHSLTLYLTVVFIWGSTFFAITFQLGEVPVELSIAYRFALAAVLLFAWCRLKNLRLRLSAGQHLWISLQGLMLFGLNYLVIYWATNDLTSGLIAVVFSTIVLMNIANAALFLKRAVNPAVVAGGLFGLAGICLVFWPELKQLNDGSGALRGLLFSLLGTFFASLGNVIAARNQINGMPVVQTNAYGMAYGAIILASIALLQGVPWTFSFAAGYSLSLLYLALFGSVLAFGSYLTLLGRIGPDRAAYTMVVFPLVPLGLSTLFEGYQWSLSSIGGVILVVVGNLLLVASRNHVKLIMNVIKPGDVSEQARN